jgi:tetratricopeptide (TPR) repeat protein
VFSQNIQEDDSLSYYNFIAKKELDSANYKKAVSIADRAIKEGYVSNKILKTRAVANYKLRQTKKAFLDIEEIIMSDEDNLDISPLISLYYINIESPNNAISILVNSFNEDNKTFFHSLSLINERDFKIIIQAIDNTMTVIPSFTSRHGIIRFASIVLSLEESFQIFHRDTTFIDCFSKDHSRYASLIESDDIVQRTHSATGNQIEKWKMVKHLFIEPDSRSL